MKKIARLLRPEEILALLFGAILLMLVLVHGDYQSFLQAEVGRTIYYTMVILILLAVLIIFMRITYGVKNIVAVLRDWFPFWSCITIYEFLHSFINVINPTDQHEILIRIDYFIFGVHPTLWFERFIHPSLTNYLTVVYLFYFISLPLLAVMLYFKRKYVEFRNLMLTAVICFYIGYSGYLMVPALPPWITQSNLYSINLYGIVADEIPIPFINTASFLRDCFPSLHTATTTTV